jgi:hypothetical protein
MPFTPKRTLKVVGTVALLAGSKIDMACDGAVVLAQPVMVSTKAVAAIEVVRVRNKDVVMVISFKKVKQFLSTMAEKYQKNEKGVRKLSARSISA